ncbi:hypothetical protein FACS189491_09450 [Spirochaetia bacterium]|nr:hypothetical protein FACS189491_09450 [Spirochaetia bacterium]
MELCFGDGFYTKYFYSCIAKQIIACDFDKDAVKYASKQNKTLNIEYMLCDIRYNMPEGLFDNIIWDAGLAIFSTGELDDIIKNIKLRLKKDQGILSGSTPAEPADGKSYIMHKYEFKNMEDLKRFFKPYFKNVVVFETIYPDRHNLYFWASDGIIPFSEDWKHWTK